MLRVVLVVSNFLEAPNGGGAGRNQQPAGPFSLRERCDSRGNNQHPTAKDSRAVALRTRERLAEPIVLDPNCNVVVRSERIGSPNYTKLLQTGAALPDQPLRPPQEDCEAILTVGYRKRGPAICGGCESREEITN
jgi:hypothetical protein